MSSISEYAKVPILSTTFPSKSCPKTVPFSILCVHGTSAAPCTFGCTLCHILACNSHRACQKTDCLRRNALSCSGKTKPLLRGCLHIHLGELYSKRIRNILPHGVNMGSHLGCLGDNGGIDIFYKETILLKECPHMTQKLYRGNPLVSRIRIREMLSDIS